MFFFFLKLYNIEKEEYFVTILLILICCIAVNFVFLGIYYILLFFAKKSNETKLISHMNNHYCGFKGFFYISSIPLIGLLIHIWGMAEILFYINKKEV